MSPDARRLTINVNVLGVGQRPAAWRSPDIVPEAIVDLGHWQRVARLAERGLVDAIFLADRPAITDPRSRPVQYLDPLVLVPAMAAATERVGFVATASTTLNEPVELARRLFSLHVATGGRFAWNAVTTWDVEAMRNFGIEELPERAERYDRAEEFVQAVRALWDAAGTREEVRHRGARLSFDASLGIDPVVPGRPAVVQAGGSAAGERLAGRVADAVYSIAHDPAASAAHRRAVQAHAAAAGRGADEPRVYPGLALVIGSTEREAGERFEHWEHQAPPTYSLRELEKALGLDLSDVDLERPLPDELVREAEAGGGWSEGYRRVLLARIRDERPTVRALLRDFGGYGQRFLAGTPERIADAMQEWFDAGAADGFNVMIDLFPSGLEDLVDHVVPVLQRRGLFRRGYDDADLLGRFRRP
ncbi:LLM class flavin-dependent oxidoreductase [Microbacterium betulae]|uniref:LLM class flavin-dependent oxidoreductase n=1 Tax=Microbacterium betulae TaxID=2981139 RepID=A0AA97FHR2_9MICO|nr:LLM class flavin-dependent oxidoreductase [Microbacterium sp. AB]WOF22789.1 LLM class flavin-dependent oxidoreductase [Microbacterium sp. AB]